MIIINMQTLECRTYAAHSTQESILERAEIALEPRSIVPCYPTPELQLEAACSANDAVWRWEMEYVKV